MTNRLEMEKKVLRKMVHIYCRGNHSKNSPCSECMEVINYGLNKIDSCIYGINKPFCSKCTIHCYEENMKKKVKDIMRYSGPRIIFYHPIISLKHFLSSIF